MKRKAIVIGAAAVAVAVTGVALFAGRAQRPEEREARQSAVPVVERADLLVVRRSATPRTLEATGSVQPEYEATVATKVSGRILAVFAREGDRVRRGSPLVRLDARDYDAAIAQASANVRAARVGEGSSRIAASMEESLSGARISQAEAAVAQAEAALRAAVAQRDLVRTGPRRQERAQASLAVEQARVGMELARTNRDRMERLYWAGAVARMQFDTYQSQFEVAQAQYRTAQEAQSIADEGSRTEELRAAEQAVLQAEAAVQQARAGVKQARAAARQAEVRRQEIQAARAQVGQGEASLRLARVTRDYAAIAAPFDGVVSARLADPGDMAAPGVPLLRVQGGALRLHTIVPESALRYARKGSVVPVRLDALPGRDLRGRVVEVNPQGDPSSHTFAVKVALPRDSGPMAGMFGRARLTTGAEERLLVPASAVQEREGLRYVYVVGADGTARLRLVTVGDPVGDRLPVLSGLAEGERIVAGGARIADGVQVAEREEGRNARR